MKKRTKRLIDIGMTIFSILMIASSYYLSFLMHQIVLNGSQIKTSEFTCGVHYWKGEKDVYVSQETCNKFNLYEFLLSPPIFIFLLVGGIYMVIHFKFTPIEINEKKEDIKAISRIKLLENEKIIMHLKDVKFSLKTVGWSSNVYSVNLYVTNKRLIIPYKFIGEVGSFGDYIFYYKRKDLRNYSYFKNNFYIDNWSLDKNKIILYIRFTNNYRRYSIYTRYNKEIFNFIKEYRK